jgi:OmcA/MtrC family decaheme c-type cytochrome
MATRKQWIIVAGLLAVTAAAGDSVRRNVAQPYHLRPKVFPAQAVTTGLVIKVQSASVAADGTISATVTIVDSAGAPLDRLGAATAGVVTLSFVAATIPAGQEQYVSYTTRVATGVLIPSTLQAGADAGGTYTSPVIGQYTYTFATKAPAGFDASATHTIGVYGNRNLTSLSLGTSFASTTFNFVPTGAPVAVTRDVVRDASCNRCHDQISHHGGQRRGVALCVLCHTPQTTDANTGNPVDFKVMIHKIHRGSSLPSVLAGKPYQFGSPANPTDYSKVVDPADVRRCAVCHDSSTKAAHTYAWLQHPTRAACGSCHDDVNFATGAGHPAGAMIDDTRCSVCHVPQSASDFDASITGAHIYPTESSLLSGLIAKITAVNGTAGRSPAVTFTLTDSKGNGVRPAQLSSLALTMAGPTTDYGYTGFGPDTASTPGYVSESATAASCGPDGACNYTFTHAIPAGATGTYAIALEARRTETVMQGTPKQQAIQYGASNPVFYFPVDNSTVLPRRQIVAIANCNQCHSTLTMHGERRNNNEYCVMCHNPSNTDAPGRAIATKPADKALPPQGINFNFLMHRLHYGPNAAANGAKNPLVVIGANGSGADISQILYPALSPSAADGDTRKCAMCHINNSQLILPIGRNPVLDPQGWTNPNPAASGACSGCHVSKATAAHMVANTTAQGEQCNSCHTAGNAEAIDTVHAQY